MNNNNHDNDSINKKHDKSMNTIIMTIISILKI